MFLFFSIFFVQLNFRSLVGFLPAWELSGKRRPPSFTTWMQENGITLERAKSSTSSESNETVITGDRNNQHVTDDAEYNRVLQQYRDARANLLSVLVGEVIPQISNLLTLKELGVCIQDM